MFELRVKGRERSQREGREEEGESERVRGGKWGRAGKRLGEGGRGGGGQEGGRGVRGGGRERTEDEWGVRDRER